MDENIKDFDNWNIFKKNLEVSKETRNDIGSNIGAVKANAKILRN